MMTKLLCMVLFHLICFQFPHPIAFAIFLQPVLNQNKELENLVLSMLVFAALSAALLPLIPTCAGTQQNKMRKPVNENL